MSGGLMSGGLMSGGRLSGNNTRSSAYIKWLIIISPDKQPVLQQLSDWLRSSIYTLNR